MEITMLMMRVETAWDNIRENTERHDDSMHAMEREWLAMKALADEYRVQQDVAKQSRQEIAIEVNALRFVMCAYQHYRIVRHKREFTEIDQAIGKELVLLLGEGMSRSIHRTLLWSSKCDCRLS